MTKTTFFAIALSFAAVCAFPGGAAELDRAAAAVAGTEAAFTQNFTPKGFSSSTPERGSVIFGGLPMMRWSYTAPEAKLFVFDGKRSWFYVPGDKQVTVADVDDSRRSDVPFLLLGDPAARERLFNISEVQKGGSIITTLRPKSGDAQILRVVVTTAAPTHLLQRIEYTDREGNRTSFDFSDFKKRSTTPDLFRFTAPAGVEVVEAK